MTALLGAGFILFVVGLFNVLFSRPLSKQDSLGMALVVVGTILLLIAFSILMFA